MENSSLKIKPHLIKSNKGFSSVMSILLGLGIVPVAVLGIISLMSNLALGVKSGNQNTTIENAMTQVTAAFGTDERYCTAMLAGRIPFNPSNTQGQPVPQISFYNLLQSKQTDILNSGEIIDASGVRIAEIRLVPVSRLSANTALADLVFQFERGDSAIGGNRITRSIPLYVGYNTSGIVFCSASAFGLYTIPQRICQHNGLGYSTYNPMHRHLIPAAPAGTSACDDVNDVEWVQGSNFEEASCGTNRRIALPRRFQRRPSYSATGLCRTSRQGSLDLPPRTYVTSTGVVAVHSQPSGIGLAVAHPVSNECSFAHLPSVVSGPNPVQTFVRCVPQ